MKKRLNTITALILAFAMFFLVSCGDEENPGREGETTEYGIHYVVPENFKSTKVIYSEFVYTDGVAHLYFNHFSGEQLQEEQNVDPDISVYNYTRQFMAWNGIPMNSSSYDEERDIGTVESVLGDQYDVAFLPEYCRFQIMRGTYYLYVVVANCPDGTQEAYKEVFDEWFESIWVE